MEKKNISVTHGVNVCLFIKTHKTSMAGLKKQTKYVKIVTGKVMSVQTRGRACLNPLPCSSCMDTTKAFR